jgi:hypothetical protein
MQLILSPEGKKAREFRGELAHAIICQRFYVLRSGSVGLTPGKTRHGDRVAAFLGARYCSLYGRFLPTGMATRSISSLENVTCTIE